MHPDCTDLLMDDSLTRAAQGAAYEFPEPPGMILHRPIDLIEVLATPSRASAEEGA